MRKKVNVEGRKVFEAKLWKEGLEVYLYARILDENIAKLFESDETGTSNTWKDANGNAIEYYMLTGAKKHYFLTNISGKLGLYLNEFGMALTERNISILRATGIKKGVTLKLSMYDMDIERAKQLIKNMKRYIEEIATNILYDYEISTEVKMKTYPGNLLYGGE